MARKSTRRVGFRIVAFDRQTEWAAMELRIAPIDVIELRRLADLPDDLDTVLGGIDLKPAHIPTIKQWIEEVLDSKKYDVQFEETALPPSFDE